MKKLKLNSETGLTLIFTALVIFFIADSFELGNVAGWIPRATLAITLGLLVMQLLVEIRSGLHDTEPAPVSGAERATDMQKRGEGRATALAILWISCLAPMVWLFGMSVGAALFCLVYLRWHAEETWKFSIFFSTTLALVIQTGFTGIFHITLYPGMIARVLT